MYRYNSVSTETSLIQSGLSGKGQSISIWTIKRHSTIQQPTSVRKLTSRLDTVGLRVKLLWVWAKSMRFSVSRFSETSPSHSLIHISISSSSSSSLFRKYMCWRLPCTFLSVHRMVDLFEWTFRCRISFSFVLRNANIHTTTDHECAMCIMR